MSAAALAPTAQMLWDVDSYKEFLLNRRELITTRLNDFLSE